MTTITTTVHRIPIWEAWPAPFHAVKAGRREPRRCQVALFLIREAPRILTAVLLQQADSARDDQDRQHEG